MCLESLVAIMALIAACTLEPGVYLSMNVKGDPAATVANVTALGFPVTVERMNGRLSVEVADDGCGGADPASGSGLRGLADRVEALGGRLEVRSPAGEGTTVRAELPWA